MQNLLDLLNELSEKYKFSEEDIGKIQEAVFAIENGEDALMNEADDFVSPEEEVYERTEEIDEED